MSKTILNTKMIEGILDKVSTASYVGFSKLIISHASKDNKIQYNNNTNISSLGEIAKILQVSKTAMTEINKQFKSINAIRKSNNVYFINPIIACSINFEWYKEIFDLYEDYLEENIDHLEFLKIKSKFYEVDHLINTKKYDDLVKRISCIYRLYKGNKIVYIGKSICLKSRLQQHLKEKSLDYFDFTIMDNESDKNIYELYYIDKYKPMYNNDCIEVSRSNITLKELTFSNKIQIDSN